MRPPRREERRTDQQKTYVGGNSMMSITETVLGTKFDTASPLAGLGISAPELLFFGLFWSIQVAVLVRGMESIRIVEKYSAPVLIGLCGALLLWAVSAAGGFGPMLSAPSQFAAGMPKAGQFLSAFVPAVTAQGEWPGRGRSPGCWTADKDRRPADTARAVGFWAT